MSLRERTIRGLTWTGISQVLCQVVGLVISIVLARLLMPRDFGLIGMAEFFGGFMIMVNGLGMGPAIVQRKHIYEDHLSSAFWAGLLLGCGLFFVAVLISPYVAVFFGEEMVRPVLITTSLALIIVSAASVHHAVLDREMRFKELAVIEISATLGSGAVALLLAVKGYGVWSLVFGGLVGALLRTMISWKVVPWRPSFKFSMERLRDLWGFSMNMTGFLVLNYIRGNIDYLLVGRFLGSSVLGVYTLAYKLVTIPHTRILPAVSKVLFPAFSKMQDDNERLRGAYLKVIGGVALFTFPMAAGLMVVAPELVSVVFGEKWAGAVIPVQILCVAGAIYGVSSASGTVLLGKGRASLAMKIGLFGAVLISICVFTGLRWGVNGVAAGVAVYSMIAWLIMAYPVNRLIELRMGTYLAAIRPAVGPSLVMIGVILGYQYGFRQIVSMPDSVFVLSAVVLGALVYVGTLKMSGSEIFDEMLGLVKEVFKPAERARVLVNTK